jgi:hypothetical protein
MPVAHLHEWHEFYLLIGSAAAALTGLMFVVVSIGPKVVAARDAASVRTFLTPMVVHFTSVVVISALMMMPSIHAGVLAALLALGSVGVLGYIFAIGVQRRWRENNLDWQDWLGYVALPVLAYFVLIGAASEILQHHRPGLWAVAAGTVLLLVVSIRNAWDLILFMAKESRE